METNSLKVALVTTTINVPTVLSLYRAYNEHVRFFVAGDEKTPAATGPYVEGLGNARYIPPAEQTRWECSGFIGMNCIQRRNIATLEALEWGADVLIFWDDDNIPLCPGYFDHFTRKLSAPFDGPCVHGGFGWFDPGKLLLPPVKHRGFPYDIRSTWGVGPAVNAKLAVCTGMVLGDPDIESTTRMVLAPEVYGVSALAQAGFVVGAFTWTVFNSQNTGFTREIAPALFLPPGLGRYDDIVASLICQRVMRDRDTHVHIGHPLVHQDRNTHNLVKDLQAEMFGIEHIGDVASWLNDLILPQDTVLAQTDFIYREMEVLDWMPSRAYQAGQAWCRDLEKLFA